MKRNIFKLFLNKLLGYPLWIKQAVYYRLWQDMTKNNCADIITNSSDSLISTHIPILTFAGKRELWDKTTGLDSNIYSFLKYVHNGYSLMEIALNMFMSMEEISKIYIFCLEQNYIESPEQDNIYAVTGFISGKFQTGDYFIKIGKITEWQLEAALNKQKEYVLTGEHKLIGNILIDEGAINKEDIRLLFKIKSEAKKRFVMQPEIFPENTSDEKLIQKYETRIQELQKENSALKKTMAKIIETVKDYDI